MAKPRGLPVYRKIDRRGVSEVIGTVLLLAMTVVVFSGIILFVNSLTGPGNQTYVDLIPSIDRIDPNNGVVYITHAGGQPLNAFTTAIIVQVNESSFPLAVADGLAPVDGKWVTGQRWAVPFAGNQLSQNATIQVSVIDQSTNQVVLLAVVQRGIGVGGAFPIIGTAAVIPDGYVYNSGQHLFKVRVVAVDYDNDLPRDGVVVHSAVLGCGFTNQTLADVGFGVFESVSWSNASSCLPPGFYPVNITATDLVGHVTRSRLVLEVRSVVPANQQSSSGTGPFGWAFTNRFQAFEIYEATEWDTRRFNGTPTRDFTRGQTVVVVVASQFLKNIDLQNDLNLFSPAGLPVRPLVYGGGSPTDASRPSSSEAFDFEEFVAGYFIYSARFNTNSAAYGFNGSELSPGQYNLEITLRTSNLPPPDNRFNTATVINVTDVGGVLPAFPRMEFYHDKAFLDRDNEFNFTDLVYVKITVNTTDDTVMFGALTIADYQGGIEIFSPPGNPPVSDITVKNATVYWFVVDLASPNRDVWIFDTNAYGISLNQLIDQDEKYALSGQIIIHGPKWGADVISSMREWRNFWRDDRVYSVMYENDNEGNWDENYVASYISGSRWTPRWAGRDMLDVMLADMDGDGSLDAVMGSSAGFVLLFRNLDGVGHEWGDIEIDNFGGPDVVSVAAGMIDADQFNDVVAGTDNGQIWWYHNDGSWTPLICDRVQGRRNCDVSQSEDSAPVLIQTISGARINDLKLADMNGDGTNDLVAALSTNTIRVFYNDGFGNWGDTGQTDYNMSADSAVQGTVSNTYTSTQSTNNAYESIREVNGTGQSIETYAPIGEVMSLYGQVETGSYANTLAYDGAPYQVLSETFYSGGGGKWMIRNSTSGSSPGHQYSFGTIPTISGSDYAVVTVSAFLSTGTEPMEIRYKVGTGAASSVLGTFSETSMTTKSFTLPSFTGGELYVVVQDSDISGGDDDPGGDAKQTKVSLDLVALNVYRANGTTSRLEHKWQTATIGAGGSAYRLFAEVNHTSSNETDDMLFEWGASSSGPWSPLFTVTKVTDDNGYQSALLPTSVGGTQIYIRVTDVNRSANATVLDTVTVDHMFVRRYTVVPNYINISTGWNCPELVIGDMNGDGRNDIVAARGLSNGAQIFYGRGFNTSTILTTPVRSYSLDIGYIDGDDQLDVVIGENSQFVHQFLNLNGTWTRTQFSDLSPVRNTVTTYLRIGDIDGDGYDDVMLATQDGDILFYRHLQGTGWELAIVDNLRRPIWTIDIGDVDRGVVFDYANKLQ